MADYKEGDVTWQGFLRPYADAEEAKAVFEKYLASAKQDGGEVKKIEAEGADRMVVSSNIGLVDAIFLKGNVIGGANGGDRRRPRPRRSPGRSSRPSPPSSPRSIRGREASPRRTSRRRPTKPAEQDESSP